MGADGDDIAKLYADQMLQHLRRAGPKFSRMTALVSISRKEVYAPIITASLRFTDVVKAAGTQIDGRANLHICTL